MNTIPNNNEEKPWFRLKRYPHIGLPLLPKDEAWVKEYVSDPTKIAEHSFLPFIHKKTLVRKFRKEVDEFGKRSKGRKKSVKERPLFYAGHLDSNVYSYYASVLSDAYEGVIQKEGLEEVITGYRRIPVNPSDEGSRNKCNIDFANDVFSYIRDHKEKKLIAITFDIKSFFDNLDHKILKQAWRKVTNSGFSLDKDHYNVYRNITKFSYVEERDIFNEFKNEIWIETSNRKQRQKRVKRIFNLKNNGAIAFCRKEGINRLRNKNYIRTNKYEEKDTGELVLREKGIPQGSPISSVLANIYLLDYDKKVQEFISQRQGLYRRYSDDMVVVCKPKYLEETIDFFTKEIEAFKLEIQPQKTQVFSFRKVCKRFYCFEKNLNSRSLQTNTFFDYLGFSFDGHYVMLKSASLAKYHRKMKRAIKRGHYYKGRINNNTKGELFKSRLYKRYTMVGAKRRYLYKRDPKDSSKFVLTKKYNWGNYLTYVLMAERIIPHNKIKGQIKRHWKQFHDRL